MLSRSVAMTTSNFMSSWCCPLAVEAPRTLIRPLVTTCSWRRNIGIFEFVLTRILSRYTARPELSVNGSSDRGTLGREHIVACVLAVQRKSSR